MRFALFLKKYGLSLLVIVALFAPRFFTHAAIGVVDFIDNADSITLNGSEYQAYPQITIFLMRTATQDGAQSFGPIATTNGTFSFTIDTVTSGTQYTFEILDLNQTTLYQTIYTPNFGGGNGGSPEVTVGSVNGGMQLSGTGFSAATSVDLDFEPTGTADIISRGPFTISNGTFSYTIPTSDLVPNTGYSYDVFNHANGALMKHGVFLSDGDMGGGDTSSNTDPEGNDTSSDTNPNDATFNFSIDNPVSGINTLPELIEKLLDIVMTIAIPIVALFIIYAGYLFVKARGNKDGLQAAKDALLYAIIGAAIVLAAYVIAQAIQGTVEQLAE